ncbi:bile acid:sodium symporter family protein [Rothia sp. P13129]|uniref:bile acid:sodium symporter family protein n=1 Tax=Rothia sp. P13129 TaxID=3402664 RepID=UPI003AD6F220
MALRIPRITADPLIMLIVLAAVIAFIAPATGAFAESFSFATKIAIALLFFLYGSRLSPQQALEGLKHWRLHLLILAFTFIVFPFMGVLLFPMGMVLGHELYLGILYMTLVPSTVQSSVAFTSIARGNVAGAIVSASVSNIVGVFATPLLVMFLMHSDGITISGNIFLDIAIQLLAPFIAGQLMRRWSADFAHRPVTKQVDRLSIAMVVYMAFSEGIVHGVWSRISWWQLSLLVIFSILFVYAMLWLTRAVASRAGFSRQDIIAIQFCGTKKSLATGLPMAAVIFGSSQVGVLIVPLMIFHQVQLMVCAHQAAQYAKKGI